MSPFWPFHSVNRARWRTIRSPPASPQARRSAARRGSSTAAGSKRTKIGAARDHDDPLSRRSVALADQPRSEGRIGDDEITLRHDRIVEALGDVLLAIDAVERGDERVCRSAGRRGAPTRRARGFARGRCRPSRRGSAGRAARRSMPSSAGFFAPTGSRTRTPPARASSASSRPAFACHQRAIAARGKRCRDVDRCTLRPAGVERRDDLQHGQRATLST